MEHTHLRSLLHNSIISICKGNLPADEDFKVEGLLVITVKQNITVVNINKIDKADNVYKGLSNPDTLFAGIVPEVNTKLSLDDTSIILSDIHSITQADTALVIKPETHSTFVDIDIENAVINEPIETADKPILSTLQPVDITDSDQAEVESEKCDIQLCDSSESVGIDIVEDGTKLSLDEAASRLIGSLLRVPVALNFGMHPDEMTDGDNLVNSLPNKIAPIGITGIYASSNIISSSPIYNHINTHALPQSLPQPVPLRPSTSVSHDESNDNINMDEFSSSESEMSISDEDEEEAEQSIKTEKRKDDDWKPQAIEKKKFSMVAKKSTTKLPQNMQNMSEHSCLECGKMFPRRKGLIKHKTSSMCQKRSGVDYDLNTNTSPKKESKEGITYIPGDPDKNVKNQYICEQCNKVFTAITSYRDHSHVHSQNKPYNCPKCPDNFSHRNNFMKHLALFHEDEPLSNYKDYWRFACEKCGKVLKSIYSLDYHLKTHTSGQEFPCSKCQKVFTRPNALKLHKAMHELQRTNSYEEYATESNLINRKRLNTSKYSKCASNSIIQCKYCTKTLTTSAGMAYHEKTVHSNVLPSSSHAS